MSRSQIWRRAAIFLLTVLIPAGIRAQDMSEVVVIRGGKMSVAVGEQVQFSAQKLGGVAYAPGLAAWRSLNEDVFAIDQNGSGKGLKPGSATIMATVGRSTSTLDLTVVAATSSVVTSQPSIVQGLAIQGKRTLAIEEQTSLSATINGSPAANVSWLSADPATVAVDASGKAKGLRPGKAIIIASAGELSDFVAIDVTGQQMQAAAVPSRNPMDASVPDFLSTPALAPAAISPPAITPDPTPAATLPPPDQKPVLQWPPIEFLTQPAPASAPTRAPDEALRSAMPNEQTNKQLSQEQKMQALQALLNVLGSAAQQPQGGQPFSAGLQNQPQQSQNPGVNSYMNMFNYFLNQPKGGNQPQGIPNMQGSNTGQITQQLTGLLGMFKSLKNNSASQKPQAVQGLAMPNQTNQTNQVAQQLMSLLGNYSNAQPNSAGQASWQAAPGQAQNAQFLQTFMSLMNNIQQTQNNSPNQSQPGVQQLSYINSQTPLQQGGQQQPVPSSIPSVPYVAQQNTMQQTMPSDRNAMPNSDQIATLLSALAASIPTPKNLVNARTVFVSYQQNYDRVISDFPKKLREWGRWTIVNSPDQADILLYLSQGRLSVFSNEIVVQVYDSSQRNIATVSCERRISGTGGVLVNRLKKELEKQEKPNKK